MQLELPAFDDVSVNEVFAELPTPATVSIRGVPGSGKTIFAEHLIDASLAAGQANRVLLLGETDADRKVLNQATGVGVELLSEIPSGRLAVEVLEDPAFRAVCHNVTHYPDVDTVVIDPIDEIPGMDADHADRLFTWLSAEVGVSVVTIGETEVNGARSYADLAVDFEQLSGAEDLWYADAVLSLDRPGTATRETRAFRIEGYDIQMWEAT
ncbi:MAG: hypothetical protein PPP58_03830 [Natronomonas sp.]